jgi:hypothetical protein
LASVSGRRGRQRRRSVGRPDAVDRLVEDARARRDVQGGSVVDAAHHDVVDPSAALLRPGSLRQQPVVGGEGVPGVVGVDALPGVPVADAGAFQRLAAAPEMHAGRLRNGVEVAGDDHVQAPPADQRLDGPGRRHGLQFALVLEVEPEVGVVVGEQQRADRLRRQDLGDQRHAGELLVRARGHVQVDLVHVAERPAAGDRGARPVGLPARLVGEVVAGAEQPHDLVVVVELEGFLERDQVRSQLAQAGGERRLAARPCRVVVHARPHPADDLLAHRVVAAPQVERGDA